MLDNTGDKWQNLFFLVAILYTILAFALLVSFISEPKEVGLQLEEDGDVMTEETSRNAINDASDDQFFEAANPPTEEVQSAVEEEETRQRIGFCEAMKTKNVFLTGLCYFCVKFVAYSIMLWMPLFLDQELGYTKQEQANLLSLLEVGILLGAVLLGLVTDVCYSRRFPIYFLAMGICSMLCFFITFNYQELSRSAFAAVFFMLGFFLGSVYQINTTAAADLGRQVKDKKATSTITGIIDACGNSGAGIG